MGDATTYLRNSTIIAQNKLGNYVKDGIDVKIEGTNSDRLHHYRRLVFNVIFDTLSSAYPISRKQIGSKWKSLVDRFFSFNKCENYQVWRMPQEFISYVEENERDLVRQMPFLLDLLFFEWIEIELYSEEDIELENYSEHGNWLKDRIVLNPHFRIIQLEYPVYKVDCKLTEDNKGLYYLLIFRDLEELKVRFLELSSLFAEAIVQVNDFNGNLFNALYNSSKKYGVFSREELGLRAESTFKLLRDRGLIIGFK